MGATSFRSSTYSSYLEQLNNAQKSGAGVPAYTRWVNRRVARRVAASAAALGLTPNAVTMLSAAFSLAGLVVMLGATPGWTSAACTAVLLATGYVFDSADGQVARLTGTSSAAGEWLDHVVDAVRTPAIHLTVVVSVLIHRPEMTPLASIALLFTILSTGQFMSQILAEQLVRRTGGESLEGNGTKKSLLLLPTDTGVLCWSFLLWGAPTAFGVAYALLFIVNLVHGGVSMRRKYRKLSAR